MKNTLLFHTKKGMCVWKPKEWSNGPIIDFDEASLLGSNKRVWYKPKNEASSEMG